MDRWLASLRTWAASDRLLPKTLDSMVMEPRDRLINLGVFGAAAVVWVLVGLVITTRDPIDDPVAGFLGAGLIGLAIGLTLVPIMWLVVFVRHRQIAYQGDWTRAARRGGWVGLIVAIFIVLRLQGALELPIVLFIVALAAVAEATLSTES
jgi:cobalamin synthase